MNLVLFFYLHFFYHHHHFLDHDHHHHCHRVLGPLSNLYDFAKAYSCPVGSKMNPVKKCSVWWTAELNASMNQCAASVFAVALFSSCTEKHWCVCVFCSLDTKSVFSFSSFTLVSFLEKSRDTTLAFLFLQMKEEKTNKKMYFFQPLSLFFAANLLWIVVAILLYLFLLFFLLFVRFSLSLSHSFIVLHILYSHYLLCIRWWHRHTLDLYYLTSIYLLC